VTHDRGGGGEEHPTADSNQEHDSRQGVVTEGRSVQPFPLHAEAGRVGQEHRPAVDGGDPDQSRDGDHDRAASAVQGAGLTVGVADDRQSFHALDSAAVELYWLPLGAGGHSVRSNGRVLEWIGARLQHRSPNDLYHSALEVRVDGARWVIEQAPASPRGRAARGVVVEGAVGARWAGRWRLFRYEVRRWRNGAIPDIGEAVDSPQTLSADSVAARRLLDAVSELPTPAWGRDELRAGEMWNSNSIVAWLLVRSGIDPDTARLPQRGRAPGWHAGLVVARRAG